MKQEIESFFFYDLETSGFNARSARIMQFAGQRTNMELEPIGEPVDVLIKMTDDVLPDPGAILVTGITPQKTISDGITEKEFLDLFHKEIATEKTVFIGFNSLRFDDEFMRHLHYRNFYDPYEWHWKGNRSRWDLLDVVRMTRALRPEGIEWPVSDEGVPVNKLEVLAKSNQLEHESAHDALSDVNATIALAGLIRSRQPKLFDYLFSIRKKDEVKKIVSSGIPFVYSSGKYENQYEKTTVAAKIVDHPDKQGAVVFDLRYDPTPYLAMTAKELAEVWKYKKGSDDPRLPAKTLQYNRCPAIAPLNVLNDTSQERINLNLETIKNNHDALLSDLDFPKKIVEALRMLDAARKPSSNKGYPDEQLYDGFLPDNDRQKLQTVQKLDATTIAGAKIVFGDKRLNQIFPLYKARNFSSSLTPEEYEKWEDYRIQKLLSGSPSVMKQFVIALDEQLSQDNLSPQQRFILEDLQLYAESIMPGQD